MLHICDPQQNYILRTLSPQEFEHLAPCLELVSLPYAKVLYQTNEEMPYAYFPTTSAATLLCSLEDGTSVEVAMVGNEGLLGISVFMGGNMALTQAVIHTAGFAYRISAKALKEALDRSGGRREGGLQQLLQRYTQMLIMHMAQTTACHRRHSLDQQLSRWLLLSLDRMNSNSLAMTHQLISDMLGVRRETITEATRRLQQAGIISTHRGHINIMNRPKLEAHVCECYGILKSESERYLNTAHLDRPNEHGQHLHD